MMQFKNNSALSIICNLYLLDNTLIKKEVGVEQEVIDAWVSGTKQVDEKYLNVLQNKYGVPKEFFNKELDIDDESKVIRYVLNYYLEGIEDKGVDIQGIRESWLMERLRYTEIRVGIIKELLEAYIDSPSAYTIKHGSILKLITENDWILEYIKRKDWRINVEFVQLLLDALTTEVDINLIKDKSVISKVRLFEDYIRDIKDEEGYKQYYKQLEDIFS